MAGKAAMRSDYKHKVSDEEYKKACAEASKGNLPWDSPSWALANKEGRTVAHTAAYGGPLPKGFRQWDLADNHGRTVAHTAAKWGTMPKEFHNWDLTDNYGRIVRDVFEASGGVKD
jgi:hypothetical protein